LGFELSRLFLPQVGHLLAFAQAETGDRALPLITQTMHLLRTTRLAALQRRLSSSDRAVSVHATTVDRAPVAAAAVALPPALKTTTFGLVVLFSTWGHALSILPGPRSSLSAFSCHD
jgi:hypothetical protein